MVLVVGQASFGSALVKRHPIKLKSAVNRLRELPED